MKANKFKALVTVGGVELPEPSSYSSTTATMVDEARNTAGVMVGTVVRDNVAKIEVQWKYLTVEDWADISALFDKNFKNQVTFYDQSKAGWVTKEMYVSDRTAGMWRRNPRNGDIMGWTGCRIALIEV